MKPYRKLHVVIYLTKKFSEKFDEEVIVIKLVELYPFGAKWEGRPLQSVQLDEDEIVGFECLDFYISYKTVEKQLLKLLSGKFVKRDIKEVEVWKIHSDLEFEPIFEDGKKLVKW